MKSGHKHVPSATCILELQVVEVNDGISASRALGSFTSEEQLVYTVAQLAGELEEREGFQVDLTMLL